MSSSPRRRHVHRDPQPALRHRMVVLRALRRLHLVALGDRDDSRGSVGDAAAEAATPESVGCAGEVVQRLTCWPWSSASCSPSARWSHPLKYLATDGSSLQGFGESLSILWLVHGWIFMVYVVVAFLLARRARLALVMLIAGLVPLLIFWVERPVAPEGTSRRLPRARGILLSVTVRGMRRRRSCSGVAASSARSRSGCCGPSSSATSPPTWSSARSVRGPQRRDGVRDPDASVIPTDRVVAACRLRGRRRVRRQPPAAHGAPGGVDRHARVVLSTPLKQALVEIGDLTFEDLPIRFQVCAASIERAAEHWLETPGRSLNAVVASAAVPGLLPPAKVGDEHYLDGGVRQLDPARSRRYGFRGVAGIRAPGRPHRPAAQHRSGRGRSRRCPSRSPAGTASTASAKAYHDVKAHVLGAGHVGQGRQRARQPEPAVRIDFTYAATVAYLDEHLQQ